MSEFPHDSFAKNYLTELLSTIGTAVPNKFIKSERREGDVWFERDRKLSVPAQRKKLGLMGQLLVRDSLIEVFRNPASDFEIRSCIGKLIDIESGFVREANRLKKTVADEKLPYLWLIMPTASGTILRGIGFQKARIPGVYRLPKLNRVGLIVVHQLAVTEETLWLRLLGSEGNQNRAIQELVTQPPALYANIEEVLADYRADLESIRSLTKDEEELIMNLSVAYLKKREEWREEGKLEGKLEDAVNLLQLGVASETIAKGLGLSIETVEKLRDRL
jgi:hypothetical protein